MTQADIEQAISYATTNEEALQLSNQAGCYYCLQIYDAKEVTDFLATERTALCPKCGIDSVIPDTAPFELTPKNLVKLHAYWF